MRLLTGVGPADAAQALQDLARKAENLRSFGTPGQQLLYRDKYLEWVEDAERACAALFEDDEHLAVLYSDRYARLATAPGDLPRLSAQLGLEVDRLVGRLHGWAEQLAPQPQGTAGVSGGFVPGTAPHVRVVPDTNVLLHFRGFDELDWTAVLGAERVDLVVPLLVVEEMDQRKNRGDDLGRRAGGVLRRLTEALERQARDGVGARPGVRVEVPGDPPGHARRPNNDDEILDRAQLAMGDAPVVVVTGDTAMRLRAQARGLAWLELPDELRLPPLDPAERKLRAAREELERERNRRPRVWVGFSGGASFLQLPERRPADLALARRALDRHVEQELGECRKARPSGGPTFVASLRPTREELERYDEQVEQYRVELGEWARQRLRQAAAHAVAVSLPLVVVNDGGASAEDVEVNLRLPSDAATEFWLKEELEEALEKPLRPLPPTPGGAPTLRRGGLPWPIYSQSLDTDWEVEDGDRLATRRIGLLRHGGAARELGGLVLATSDGRPVAGVSLEWRLFGVRPPVESQGTLQYTPQRALAPSGASGNDLAGG